MDIARQASILAFVFITVAVSIAGCSKSPAPQSQPASNTALRIISLSPAISRTLIDFDLAKSIVGRTPHCQSIDQSIPVVGDLLNIDYEAIIRLSPTHVLVQPPASGIDQHLLELAEQRGWSIGQWRLNGRDDIEALVTELPVVVSGDDRDRLTKLSRRAAEITNQIAEALSPGGIGGGLFHGRVLIVHAEDPAVLVSGAGTYHDDILRTLGATNAATATGWAKLTIEDVVRLNPDAIILVRPGAPAGTTFNIAAPTLAALDIAAIRQARTAVAKNADGELPSSGIIGVAREIKSILHRFAKPAENTP
jgi:ABC-type hemin transport system substrate-binding protein